MISLYFNICILIMSEFACLQAHVCTLQVPAQSLLTSESVTCFCQVFSAAHGAESHTTPSPKVSAFSSKHTHTPLPVALHPGLVASHAVSLRSVKALCVFRQPSRTTFKPIAPHSFSNNVRHKYLLTHSQITNIYVFNLNR